MLFKGSGNFENARKIYDPCNYRLLSRLGFLTGNSRDSIGHDDRQQLEELTDILIGAM